MSLKTILASEGIPVGRRHSASVVDADVKRAIMNSMAPIGEIVHIPLRSSKDIPGVAGRKIKIFVPGWRKIIIDQIKRSPRKWVLQEWVDPSTSNEPNLTTRYWFPYRTIATGDYDPMTNEFSVDTRIDEKASDLVGNQ